MYSATSPKIPWCSGRTPRRALLHSIDGVTDTAARKRAFEQLHQMMMDDVPMIVLYDSPDLTLVSNRLQGVTTWPLRLKRFSNVTKN